jgi:hypothetical protein
MNAVITSGGKVPLNDYAHSAPVDHGVVADGITLFKRRKGS